MTVLVGRLVSGPKMLEITDLEIGSTEQIRQWCTDLISSFGISRTSPSLLPTPLSPDELREINSSFGQQRRLNLSLE